MDKLDEILDDELSENMLDILKDIPIFREWIKDAMLKYAELYHNDKLHTLQASQNTSKLDLADVSNNEVAVCVLDICDCGFKHLDKNNKVHDLYCCIKQTVC